MIYGIKFNGKNLGTLTPPKYNHKITLQTHYTSLTFNIVTEDSTPFSAESGNYDSERNACDAIVRASGGASVGFIVFGGDLVTPGSPSMWGSESYLRLFLSSNPRNWEANLYGINGGYKMDCDACYGISDVVTVVKE